MATIRIIDTILDGNLGAGWRFNSEAADALADYMSEIWTNDLESFSSQGHKVLVSISVQYNTSGCKPRRIIDIDSDDISDTEVAQHLTPASIIWERFCKSEAVNLVNG